MGILEGMVAGAGEALQNVGLQGVAAAIQAERDARMSELRLSEEATIRQRGKDDAAAERGRVADYSKPIMGQATPAATAVAESGGANDPNAPDEQYSSDVQKISRAPTAREAQQRASAAGDLKSAEVFGKDADRQEDNVRNDAKQKSEDAKWHATAAHQAEVFKETVRHNKALESNANYGRIPPAAKAQLEMASTYVMSAHKAEAEAAKALEAARKDTLASPEKIKQLESEYQASKALVVTALKQYDQIGASHFGDQWKKTEVEAAPKVTVDVSKIPKGATQALLAGKGTDAQFDKLFGEGAAAAVRKSTPAATNAPKPGLIAEKPVAPTAADYSASEKAAAERKVRLEKERAERMEKQRKRGEEIDQFNATMKKS